MGYSPWGAPLGYLARIARGQTEILRRCGDFFYRLSWASTSPSRDELDGRFRSAKAVFWSAWRFFRSAEVSIETVEKVRKGGQSTPQKL